MLAVGPEAVCNTHDMRAAHRQLRKRADLAHLCGLRLDFDGRDETACDFHVEFGGKASAWIFPAFSQALCYIVQQNLDKVCGVGACTAFACLDDVGVVCTNRWVAAKAYRVVLGTWTRLGVVASAEKGCGQESSGLGSCSTAYERPRTCPCRRRPSTGRPCGGWSCPAGQRARRLKHLPAGWDLRIASTR